MHTFLKRLLVISLSVCKLFADTLLNVKSEGKNSCNIFEGYNFFTIVKKIDSRETICNWSKGNNS